MGRLRRAAAGCAVAAGGGAALAWADPGARRELVFWTQAAPIALHYHAFDWWAWSRGWPEEDVNTGFKALHSRYAPRVHRLVLDLRGFFVKVAQMASTRDDLIAPEYLAFCKTLQSQVPCRTTGAEAKLVVAEELGRPLGDVFAVFEEDSIGSATIGQVFKAQLRDGSDVAVKVQHPGSEELFRTDVKLCLNFCKLFMKQHVPFMEEFQRMFDSEFDFRKEAEQLNDICGRLRRSPHRSRVCVPFAYGDLTTARVLTMEYIPGTKLIDGLKEASAREARRLGEDPDAYEHRMKGVPPPARWWIATVTAALRLSDAVRNLPRAVWNVVVGPLFPGLRREYVRSPAPINIRAVLDCIGEVHAWQLFDEGFFNADPHPGNVILMPDGRLGLVDFGQVGDLSVPHRKALAALLVALRDRASPEAVASCLEDMGFRFQRRRVDIMQRYGRFHFAKEWTAEDVVMGMNPMAFMDWLHAEDPVEELPKSWVLAMRMLTVLCGFRNAFGLNSNMAEELAPYAQRWAASA
eukprot:TRINITY_DN30860_c0_g1_i1.p1 TRINITY_DN30860_c0_g1~~TRINITY_DN30860_c0_g1_i1.p1  ORF type:complete len:521 (+),score=170.32 TRINITY_DN30860_c0_g1_i1:60-1622(+)